MTRRRPMALAACALACAAAIPPRALDAQVTVIDNVTIVDVTNGRLRQRQSISIEGARISRIQDASSATRAAATIDGTGMFVIPGLWDMHIHAFFSNDTARFHSTSEVMLPLFIANGVTGVRDLGSNLEATISIRDSIAAHHLIGPRMLVSGPMIDGPTTRYAVAIKVATPDEARSAVRMLKGRGVDLIKTQTLIPRDAYFALADEAATLGIPFEGHVPSAITAMEAIQARQRSFEHLIGVSDTNTTLIAAIARAGVWQCPTVINSVGTASDFTGDPGLMYWLKPQVDSWRTMALQRLSASDSAKRASVERSRRRLAQIGSMHRQGIPFLAGTDAPAGYDLVPGTSLHRELQLFVRAGLTPLEALQTATINPARYFGETAQWGTVGQGKRADLVVLARNPLADIRNTQSVVAVVADGRFFGAQALDSIRLRVMQLAGEATAPK